MDIHDVTNITGMGSLLNMDKIDRALDVEAMEENMIGSSNIVMRDQIDPAAEYDRIMREAGGEGITQTFANDYMDDTEIMGAYEPESRAPAQHWSDAPPSAPRSRPPEPSSASLPGPAGYSYSAPAGSAPYSPYSAAPPRAQYGGSPGYGGGPAHGGSPGYGAAPRYNQEANPDRSYERGAAMYNNNVVTDEDVALEDEEDQKIAMLQDIEELLEELSTMGRDISRIPRVNNDSEFDQIRRIHGIVRRKYDFSRGETFGTDLIISVAQGLGAIFDGTRSIGPFRPHLKGWHNTIRPKLRKMRYETARTVSTIMAQHDIGPGMRMAIELIPSMFIYSNMYSSAAKYNPDSAAAAYSDIRDYES